MARASQDVLRLYRKILRSAKNYPSIKRNGIITEIQAEFRAHREEADPDKLIRCYEEAENGRFNFKLNEH